MINDNNIFPILSVVIIGLNEEKKIGNCIKNIMKATEEIPGTEIVYIDSGSTDKTTSIALQNGIRVYQLGKKQLPSPAAGRYVGSLVTKGKYIMFVDGDTNIIHGWVSEALKKIESDSKIAMVGGTFLALGKDEICSVDKVSNLEPYRSVLKIGGACSIVSREVLEKCGNWNPFVRSEEEEDLANRIHHFFPEYKILKSSKITAFGWWYKNLTFSEIIRRWKRGFLKGSGLAFKNAIVYGYWKQYLYYVRKPANIMILFFSLVVSLLWKYGFFVLLGYLVFIYFRAVLYQKKMFVFPFILFSFISGLGFLWEFILVKSKNSSNYILDYIEIKE